MINNDLPLDRMFQALADGHRRQMIDRLAAGPLTVSDLALPMGISLPAVMQHLSVLEACGLVQSHKQGRVRTCALTPDALAQAEAWISARRMMVEARLTRLEQFLATDKEDGA
ncbi:MAG: helix-turn-helix transcriptional regulator [Rhodobacteraceae bacterium]|nr:helix-turn-helix transcriptional regulator [Paracoccaceae bacterium]